MLVWRDKRPIPKAAGPHPAAFVVFGNPVPPSFDVRPLDLEQVRHVARLARSCDRREIGALHPGGYEADSLSAEWMASCGDGFVGLADGVPTVVVGAAEMLPGVWSAGMFATEAWPGIAFRVTNFIRRRFIPAMVTHHGMRRAEARSIEGHPHAGPWLLHMGFRQEAVCPDFGMRGETFHLYAWRFSDHV